jgi:regulator of protease activity HflC (stomatin/prohibitin superfamily)
MRNSKVIGIVAVLVLITMFMTCNVTKVGPKEIAIKANYLFSDKGIEHKPYSTGYQFYGPGSDMIVYPVHNVNYAWTKDSREGSEHDEGFEFPINGGLTIGVDLGIEFAVNPALAWKTYSEYPYDLDELRQIVIRKGINDALNHYGPGVDIDRFVNGGINDIMNKVNAEVKAKFAPDGIIIKSVSLINAPRYPEAVKNSITSKIGATQKAIQRENELRETEAQAKKVVAQAQGAAKAKMAEADGIAYYNKKAQENLTPLLIQMEKIKRWNGVQPTYVGGGTPIIDLR